MQLPDGLPHCVGEVHVVVDLKEVRSLLGEHICCRWSHATLSDYELPQSIQYMRNAGKSDIDYHFSVGRVVSIGNTGCQAPSIQNTMPI